MKKTIISLMLIFSFVVCSFSGNFAFAKEDENVAQVVLGSSPRMVNINKVEMGGSSTAQVVERDKKSAWLCDKALGKTTGNINIDVSDSFLSNINDGTSVEIEVEYFDSGKGYFTLMYDGIESATSNAEIVYCGISSEWKTHTFVIDDAYFGNRLDGFDFRICIFSPILDVVSPASVAFGSINLKKVPQKNPVRVSFNTEEIGNIFNNSDEQIFNIKLENLQNQKFEGKIKYEAILRSSNSVEWTSEEQISLSEKQVIDKEIKMDVSKYGLYFLQVTISNENTNSVSKKVFSLVNTNDEDPINEHFLYNTHSTWGVSYKDLSELIKKSGGGGLREAITYRYIERPMGVYNLTAQQKDMLSVIAENGFRFECNLSYGSTFINSNWKLLPVGELALKNWSSYCNYVATQVKEYGIEDVIFEVWNEPFFVQAQNATPENYIATAKGAFEAVKEVMPDSKVAIGSQTGVTNPKNQEAFKACVDGGIMNYADYISLHPYARARDCNESGTAKVAREFYQKISEEAAGRKVPVVNTEIGFSQTDYYDDAKTTERAADVVISYIALAANGCCETFEYYDLIRDGHISTFREDCFGSLNNKAYLPYEEDYSATEAYVAISNLNYLITDAEYKEELKIGDNSKCYRFYSNKFNKDVAILWTYDNTKEVTIDLGCSEIECYDIFGNKVLVNGNNGVFSLNCYGSPLYVVGNFSNFTAVDTPSVVKYDHDFVWNTISGDINTLNITKTVDGNATVEIDCPSTVTVIENGQFEGNVAKVLFKVDNNIGVKNPVNIKIVKDGKVLQSNTFMISCSSAVSSDFSVYMSEGGDISDWTGKIRIDNNSNSNCASGRIIFKEPNIWNKMIVPIGNIPSGLSSEVTVNFPKMKQLGSYTYEYVIELSDGQRVSSTDTLNFSVAQYADNKPTIDGIINADEWNKVAGMVSDDPSQVKVIPDYAGTKDLSATSYVMWDEEYLYFASDVIDDVFSQPEVNERIWAGDSIQLGVVYDEDSDFVAIGQANTTYTEFGIGKTIDGIHMWRWSSQDGSKAVGKITSAESAVIRNGEHTTYEFRIPWSEILPENMTVKGNKYLGFSMLVNDNDGNGRRGWIEYGSGIGESKDTSLFTQIKLLESVSK